MKTRIQRFGYYLAIILIALGLSGCVYLRLLKLKKQFQHFERYVLLENTCGLSMTFKKPVLFAKDVAWLLDGKPAIRARSGRNTLFKYDFKKMYPDDQARETDVTQIALFFLFQEDKLYKVRFPKAFSRYIQPELLMGSLRSVGSGTVDKQQRSVSATFPTRQQHLDKIIPTQSEVEHILGTPYRLTETSSSTRLFYQYGVQVQPHELRGTLPIVRLWLSFSPGDHKIISAKVSLNGMVTAVHF